jgi:hypothetical protein
LRRTRDGHIRDALSGEEIFDQIRVEQWRGGVILQPRLRLPLGKELGQDVDLDGHIPCSPVKLGPRRQGVPDVADAMGRPFKISDMNA